MLDWILSFGDQGGRLEPEYLQENWQEQGKESHLAKLWRRNIMASKVEFVQYIADQLQEAGMITCRKMFGDYGIYCDGKIFALICDDQLFVKCTEGGRKLAPDLQKVPPYEGAKPYFLIEAVDDREFLVELVTVTCRELPAPKPKKTRKSPFPV